MEAWLVCAARMRPQRVAIDGPAHASTYAELLGAARATGGALLADGVVPGDRVAIGLEGVDLLVVVHACLLIGAVAVPLDARLPEGERASRAAGSRLTVTERPAVAEGTEPAPVRPLDPTSVATLMFTSGTTAGPKPVTLTVANWLANAVGSALALGLDPAERWLCPMPLAHVGGLSIALRSAVYGTTVVQHARFDTAAVLDALAEPDPGRGGAITLVSLVPTMLARLLDAGLHAPPTLRRVLLGGGPIAPGLLERAAAAGVPVSPSFGMTETCSQIATDGWPLLGAELSLTAEGELLVRGPSVSAGALAADGWLHTGDLARFDAEGRLQIVGRRADTIVSGGENVAPAEVEAVLVSHPALADAAVLGRADFEWGERVVAQIVVRPDHAVPDDAQLRAWCARRLAGFQVPKAFERVESVPRGVTGKLQRRELR